MGSLRAPFLTVGGFLLPFMVLVRKDLNGCVTAVSVRVLLLVFMSFC